MKNLFLFPVLFIICAFIALLAFDKSDITYRGYSFSDKNLSHILEKQMPKEYEEHELDREIDSIIIKERESVTRGDKFRMLLPDSGEPRSKRKENLRNWRLQEIAKWNAIHANPSAAKREVVFLLLQAIALGFAGLATSAFSCFFLYKTCRLSIPAGVQAATRAATTPPRRIGLLLLCAACILLIWAIASTAPDWRYGLEDFFDTDYSHGIIAMSGVILLVAGIILSSGTAERLVAWVKTGK